jgi:leader peptidase (prepilin peptidase) / N-methyltransferase
MMRLRIPLLLCFHAMLAMTPCILFGVFGLLLGSFLNVCILRLPAGESVVRPRSHCRHCGRPIAGWDNIPVLSWLLLRATCGKCGQPISWRYPTIELAICGLFIMCCLHFASALEASGQALLCFLLLGLAVMDAETLLLPDAFTLPGLGAGFLFAGLRHGIRGAGVSLMAAAAAAATLLLISGTYWLMRRRMGMGLGDVKLLAMIGAWLGVRQTALVLFLGVIAGAVYGVGLLLVRRRRDDSLPAGQLPVPFGTMLCAAGLYSVFLGPATINWYLQFFK